MPARRPQIAVSAKFGRKRKLRPENYSVEKKQKTLPIPIVSNFATKKLTKIHDKTISKEQLSYDLIFENSGSISDKNLFKYVNDQKQNPILSFEDKSEKMEVDIIQQDLQRFAQGAQSTFKHRQIIRPSCFGLSRNCTQGNSSENEPKQLRLRPNVEMMIVDEEDLVIETTADYMHLLVRM